MTLKGQHGIITHHAAAVINHLNEPLATRLNVHPDAPPARIQRILEQLFHH